MAIRSIGAKALQQNKSDWADEAKLKSVATKSMGTASAASDPIGPSNRSVNRLRTMRRWLALGCLGLVVVGSGGCTMTAGLGRSLSQSECIDDFMIGYRNKAMAQKAWHCRKDHFGDQCFAREFKDGFLQGYAAVAEGGNGCTPAVAPSQYWGWRYQSAGGQGAVNAWFQGFPEGVRAAEEDGVGHWRQVGSAARGPVANGQYPGGIAPAPIPVHGAPLPGLPVGPGTIAPSPVNPFYSDQEIISPPTNFDRSIDGTEADFSASESFDGDFQYGEVEYGQGSEDYPYAEVISDTNGSEALNSQSNVRTAMADRSRELGDSDDVDIDQVFGSQSDTFTIGDEDSSELQFSFE